MKFMGLLLSLCRYAFPAVRLTAISDFRQLYIMTHDSIGLGNINTFLTFLLRPQALFGTIGSLLGEDGPTHQPIEALSLCRATPNITVFRPGDGNEVCRSFLCLFVFIGDIGPQL